jgi:radical SAM protein with 4Fe4S-binding SPASM domain
MKFRVGLDGLDGSREIIYNTDTHSLLEPSGDIIKEIGDFSFPQIKNTKRFTISLGFSCNFRCGYCMQSHEKLKPANREYLDKLYEKLDNTDISNYRLEFWGGEPTQYIDTVYEIADRYNGRVSEFSMITNGSLLTIEMIEKLMKYDMVISVSHDAGSQKAKRGSDPLDYNLDAIKYLFEKYPNNCSFNSVLTENNFDSKGRNKFFQDKMQMENLSYSGEGPVDDYTENGELISSDGIDSVIYEDLRFGDGLTNGYYHEKVFGLIKSIQRQSKIENLTTKCGIDKKENYEIFSLEGRDLGCHNFTHKFKPITMHERDECIKCPVVYTCAGGCPAVQSNTKTFEANCARNFKAGMSILRVAIEIIMQEKYIVTNIEELEND